MISEKTKDRSISIYFLSFIIPVIIMLMVYIVIGIYPFGEKSILTTDLNGQYVEYFGALKDILSGDKSILYSFGKTLGGNMIGLFAYYLASPLNIIFMFFPKEMFSQAILILTLIKIGLCGLAFSFYLKNTFNRNNKVIVAFSTCYSLMAYNIIYQQNIMWLDALIILPILLYGIDKIINDKSPKIYILSLAIAIITNWYTGYMLCIFSVLYFIYGSINASDTNNIKDEIKKFIRKAWIFIYSSIIGVGISAVLLIPTAISLRADKGTFDLKVLIPTSNFKPFDLVSKYIIGSYNFSQIVDGLPNIFCGLLVLILVILFFTNKTIRVREKVSSILIIGILLISFNVSTLNIIWHGIKIPTWFPYRYSFLLSAILIIIAYKSYLNIKSIESKNIINLLIILIGIIFIMDKFNYDYVNTAFQIYSTCIFIIVYSAILYISNKYNVQIKPIILTIIVGIELFLNAFIFLNRTEYNSIKEYVGIINDTKKPIEQIKNSDKSFYRLEREFKRTHNDALLLGINGITHYSSTGENSTKTFIGNIGMIDNGNWALYGGATPISDSILGIKYILSKNNTSLYNKIDSIDGVNIYENKNALPLLCGVNNELENLRMPYGEPIKFQNDILQSMLGNKEQYFSHIDSITENLRNVRKEKNDKGYIEYSKIDKDKSAYIEYKFTIPNNNPVYAYFNSDVENNSTLSINGENKIKYFKTNTNSIINLNKFKKGDSVSIKINLAVDKLTFTKEAEISSLNMDRFLQGMNQLKLTEGKVEKYKDNNIVAKVNLKENQFIYTSIPYDDGWTVKLDGKKVDKIKVLDTFIGIKASPGEHTVEFKFVPKGMYLGGIISLVSIIIFVILIVRHKKISKK